MMDGWMDRQTEGQMGVEADGQHYRYCGELEGMDGPEWEDGWAHGWVGNWVGGRERGREGRMDGWTGRWMDQWMDRGWMDRWNSLITQRNLYMH